ncbi:MAG: hypothetical protein BGO78_02980 [Chloroflexi bacterium 44-23]|nr:MAG: hypothetical protein BGO78_02980 [Chloroflexi bacterium 44-23]
MNSVISTFTLFSKIFRSKSHHKTRQQMFPERNLAYQEKRQKKDLSRAKIQRKSGSLNGGNNEFKYQIYVSEY